MDISRRIIDKAEICIVGAGIIGVCSGLFLAKRGYKVIIIDRDYISRRASGCNAGSLSLQVKEPSVLPLAKKGMDIWEYFGKIDKKIEFKRSGGFRIAETESEANKLKKLQKEQQDLGLNVEYLEIKELLKAAPYLSKRLYAANYCKLDGFVNAQTAAQRIGYLAIKEGVKFSLNNHVKKIKVKSSSIMLETSRGIYETEKLIIAAGVWINELLNSFGIRIPFNLDINQMMVSAPEKPIIKHMIVDANKHISIKQLGHGTVVIGGDWQSEGSLVKDEKNFLLSSIKGQSDIAFRIVPCIGKFLINRMWNEFEGTTRDSLPLFGKLAGYERIYINGLSSGGFTVSPYLGKLMAELIDEGKTSEDVRHLSPNRFITSK